MFFINVKCIKLFVFVLYANKIIVITKQNAKSGIQQFVQGWFKAKTFFVLFRLGLTSATAR